MSIFVSWAKPMHDLSLILLKPLGCWTSTWKTLSLELETCNFLYLVSLLKPSCHHSGASRLQPSTLFPEICWWNMPSFTPLAYVEWSLQCWDTSHDIHQVPLQTLTSLLSSCIFWYRHSTSFIIIAPAFFIYEWTHRGRSFLFTYIHSFPLSFRTSAFLFYAEVLSPLFLFCS